MSLKKPIGAFRNRKSRPKRPQIDEIAPFVSRVCQADNQDSSSEDEKETQDKPVVELSFDNPQHLNFQLVDWAQTYWEDEHLLQRAREFVSMRRELNKRLLMREEPERYAQQKRNHKFRLPDLYNLKIGFEEPPVPVEPPEPNRQFYRTEQKPHNLRTRKEEELNTVEKIRKRVDLLEEKQKELERRSREADEYRERNLGMILGQEDFDGLFDPKPAPESTTCRKFSYMEGHFKPTFLEPKTSHFRFKDFFDKDLEDDTRVPVGYEGPKRFLVRGIHDYLSFEPRGLHVAREKNRVQGCMTRKEWVNAFPDQKSRFKREKLDLFESPWRYQKPQNVASPIREYINSRNTSTVAPRFVAKEDPRPKTFNLVKYLDVKAPKNGPQEPDCGSNAPTKSTLQLYVEKLRAEKCARRKRRRQRMRVLKIPFSPMDFSAPRESLKEEASESDWVPDLEPFESTICRDPRPDEANMQAPHFREPTLRRHPRRPREHDGGSNLDVPRMQKMSEDDLLEGNLEEPKVRDVPWVLKHRYHHEHRDHSQRKTVRVNFMPTKGSLEGSGGKIETLEQPEEVIFYDFERKEAKNGDEVSPEAPKSRYQDFISQAFDTWTQALGLAKAPREPPDSSTPVLEGSIASCLSSDPSSTCTNWSHDSGSFFRLLDKKVPLAFLTKNQTPFREVRMNHMEAVISTQADEYFGPYYHVPHAGQKIDMRLLCQPKDKFFTKQTRSMAGRRERLQFREDDPLLEGVKLTKLDPLHG